MTTLKIKDGETLVEKVSAFCDFCFEKKDCIRSPRKYEYQVTDIATECRKVVVGEPTYHFGMFDNGRPWHIRDYTTKRIVISENKRTETTEFDVCKDCAKQIVGLLK